MTIQRVKNKAGQWVDAAKKKRKSVQMKLTGKTLADAGKSALVAGIGGGVSTGLALVALRGIRPVREALARQSLPVQVLATAGTSMAMAGAGLMAANRFGGAGLKRASMANAGLIMAGAGIIGATPLIATYVIGKIDGFVGDLLNLPRPTGMLARTQYGLGGASPSGRHRLTAGRGYDPEVMPTGAMAQTQAGLGGAVPDRSPRRRARLSG